MAVLELTRDVTEKLSIFMRFLTLDDLQLDPDKLKDDVTDKIERPFILIGRS
jgi:hypothetical protein